MKPGVTKAQVAFEYMMMVIIALGFFIPVWVYINSVQREASTEFSLSYAKSAVERIASTADLVYTQGPPAKVRVNVLIPEGVGGYNITNDTVNLRVRYGDILTDVFATSKARLNGTLPTAEGNYWIEVEAVDHANYDVWIEKA